LALTLAENGAQAFRKLRTDSSIPWRRRQTVLKNSLSQLGGLVTGFVAVLIAMAATILWNCVGAVSGGGQEVHQCHRGKDHKVVCQGAEEVVVACEEADEFPAAVKDIVGMAPPRPSRAGAGVNEKFRQEADVPVREVEDGFGAVVREGPSQKLGGQGRH
jgi:hypothetical protein